ncbi:hypothetical protein F5Y10DRAFT_277326 [Nemania abortiva]|nr:hypothetical protein F5Y10DRAFT_277326 [Nemania abortiva]
MAFNPGHTKGTCPQRYSRAAPNSQPEKICCDDDTSTLGSDELETGSNTPVMDKKTCHWNYFLADSHNPSCVYESWEVISVRPTIDITNLKRILGMNVVATHKVTTDGYTGVRAVPSSSQAELELMVATAQRKWAGRKFGLARFMNGESYGQNLAKRVFALPACLPSKLGALLDCRFVATNKNPHVRREWKIVMLTPIDGALTDEGPRARRHGLLGRGNRGQTEPVQKWLAIIRGQDTRVSEKGFAAFSTASNPWLKVDETAEHASGQHQGTFGCPMMVSQYAI